MNNASAFDADWWPLEMAVAWIAVGDRGMSIKAGRVARERHTEPSCPLPSFGTWLATHGGLAQSIEAVDGSLYRPEIRGGWHPGKIDAGVHPIIKAFNETAHLMAMVRHTATGCRGGAPRSRIPAHTWQSASIVDDRKLGLILKAPRELSEGAWRKIEVRAEPFRQRGSKRGRRPAGTAAESDGARRQARYGKTLERLATKARRSRRSVGGFGE
jgi:hypothetical protein